MTPRPQGPPTVELDGAAVRRCREGKGLTQLYVAEVVGVSVDTVSRWENNRSPTVRRDNAEALAGALEVPVEDVLAQSSGVGGPAHAPPRRALFATLTLGAVAGIALWAGLQIAASDVAVLRRLPPYTPPGTAVPVVLEITSRDSGTGRVVVRETLPPGWRLEKAVPSPDRGGTDDSTLKWILPLVDGRARVAYRVRSPAGAEGSTHEFSGEIVGPGPTARPRATSGESRIDLEFVYWADGDGDFQVGDAEVLEALERLEGAGALGFDPAQLRGLWGAPEYQWDEQSRRFVPMP